MDLSLTLRGGQAFRWVSDGEWYTGILGRLILTLRQRLGGVEVYCQAQQADYSRMRLSLGVTPTASQHTFASALLLRYLRLDDDLEDIYYTFNRDPALSHAVNACWGLRLLRQDPWECLASFICSIDSSIPRITRTVDLLSRKLGEPLDSGVGAYAFPTPDAISAAGETTLRGLGLGFRAPYLWRTAQRVTFGNVDLDHLRTIPYTESKEWLLSLPGVGDKVADCVLAFSLEQSEAFPIDRWVRRALEESYAVPLEDSFGKLRASTSGSRRNDENLRQWARQRFGKLAAYAQQYLFQWRRGLG